MPAKLPAETQRKVTETSVGYIVELSGAWKVRGEGDTLEEAELAAAATYTAHRRNMLGVGEKLPEDNLVEQVAACLYLRNVQVTTGSIHAGVVRFDKLPVPNRNSWLTMAEGLLAAAEEPPEPAAAVRGVERF